MKFRKSKDEEINLGIAPLVDIVFLLLIFFMVTSHFDVASGIRIRLPKITQKVYHQEKKNITLIIAESGEAYLEGEKIDLEALGKKVEEIIKTRGVSNLILQADINVRHGTVVKAMDVAKSAGIRSIIIAAHWKAGKILSQPETVNTLNHGD
ncbi:MAG: biopolymer transporter ExbD [Deltaproteobacteria bacterium]|nr:biopolymer transporter ExbD [Deltaproteobacteria bacterium]MBW2016786.1 biopolymer transporter ExbD [Deltaproteobacteria bacterium]MBW2128462.1 biopolymer transporter ExbD [Deltaproteobacteria bacterium]MBW2303484.1 biopolymer transporter ExbD [Deltaproteobacteria bacterium]